MVGAGIAALLVVAVAGAVLLDDDDPTDQSAATATSTSATTTTTPENPTTTGTTIPAIDTADLLPSSHVELDRLAIGGENGEAGVILVSAIDSGEPEIASATYVIWDGRDWAIADSLNLDCPFITDVSIDEDQAIFIGCTGGASAIWLYAIVPDGERLTLHPTDAIGAGADGWHYLTWQQLPRPDQPDDLHLERNTCVPSCAAGVTEPIELTWRSGSRTWE